MTDQCKHCAICGDLKQCKASDCSQHQSWYAIEQQKIIEKLRHQLNEQLNDCINFDGAKLTDCIMKDSSDLLKMGYV